MPPTRLTPDTELQVAPDQVSCDLGAEAAVLNLKTGVYYGLDPMGARIWSLLAQPTTLTALRDAITAEYEVTPEVCERDLIEFLTDLAAQGLLKENGV